MRESSAYVEFADTITADVVESGGGIVVKELVERVVLVVESGDGKVK